MPEKAEHDTTVPSEIMWVLHIFFLVAFFPALAVTVPAHIFLRCKGCLH